MPATASTIIMIVRIARKDLAARAVCSASLSGILSGKSFCRISLLIIVATPRVSPAPPPMTVMKRVPIMMPANTGGRWLRAKAGKAWIVDSRIGRSGSGRPAEVMAAASEESR